MTVPTPVSDYPIDSLAEFEDEAAPVRLRVQAGRGGWRAEPVAA